MKYLLWLPLALLSLSLGLVGKVLAPVLVLFAGEDGRLIRPFSYIWGQFDADLDEGRRSGLTPSRWRYLGRVKWLMRNPAYNFAYYIAGQYWDGLHNEPVVYEETPERLYIQHDWPGGWGVYYHGPLGQLKLGWKAFNVYWRDKPWGPEWRVPICLTYSPFKRR